MLSYFSCIWLFATPWTVAARIICPWDSPGKNTGVGGCFLLQGIFLTQRSNPSLMSPALAGRLFTTRATWEAHWVPRWPQLGKSEAMKVKIKTEIESTKCVPLAEQYWTKLWLSHFDFEGFFLRPTLQDPWFPQDVLSHCDLLTWTCPP